VEFCCPKDSVQDAIMKLDKGPVLVVDPDDKTRLLGILTAEDIL
jgi:CBS domain-containing protein